MISFSPRRLSADRGTISLLPLPVGLGLIFGGVCVTASAVVGLLTDADRFTTTRISEVALGLAAAGIGSIVSRLQSDQPVTRAAAMVMFVGGWAALTGVGILAFLLAGELESPLDAVFEAVSATTTTGFTTVADPSELSHSLRFLRVILPWATGLGVLFVSAGVLPVAIAGAELLPQRQLDRRRQLVTTVANTIRNVLGLYLILTLALGSAFALAGMSIFDAITYALSTASTGGMANHADSLGFFDSVAIEWIASVGMVAAGGNLLVVWWGLRGRVGAVWRSTELRLYLLIVVVGFIIVRLDSGLSSSDSAVAITSMISTTGLRSANWGSAGGFSIALLLIAGGVGAMSGSVGSGFRIARLARIVLEVWRSLHRLLDPHSVRIVRIDGAAIDESSLSLTAGYLWMQTLALAALSVLIHVTEFDVIATLSFVVAILSNVGVVLDGGQVTNHVSLASWSQIVAIFGMLLGRLSIYPVLIAIAGFSRWLGRLRPHRTAGASI